MADTRRSRCTRTCVATIGVVIAAPMTWGINASLNSRATYQRFRMDAPRRAQAFEAARRASSSDRVRLNVTTVARSPPIVRIERFLSDAECDYLMDMHAPVLTSCFPGLPEPLVFWLGPWAATGSPRVCREMNMGTIPKHAPGNEMLRAVNDRMDSLVKHMKPPDRSPAMDFQLVQYRRGGKFRAHQDSWVGDSGSTAMPLTMMVFLNEPEEGGKTVFPHAGTDGIGVEVQPRKGELLVWTSCPEHAARSENGGTIWPASLQSTHAGSRLTNGDKWILNRFFWRPGPGQLACPIAMADLLEISSLEVAYAL